MNNIKEVFPLLDQKKRIVIIPHKNPDADALGSSLALYQFLQKKGNQVVVISPNYFPKFLNWLPHSQSIINAEINTELAKKHISDSEIIFCLDFNTLSRIDHLEESINESTAIKVLIDHHQEPDKFDYTYSDTEIPATCQLIYHLFEMMGEEPSVDIDIATCLYAGIIADTGNFRFPSVKPSTHLVASKLLEKGVSPSLVYSNLYETTTTEKLRLLAKMIDKMEYLQEIKTTIIHLNRNDLLEFNFEKGDTEGFVNYGLMIDGCVLSIAFFEDLHKENTVKISFRSKGNFDVNKFARKHFEGGGHINAAGGLSKLPMDETLQKIKTILENYKTALNPN
jgi:bifunctional oligoribonuclease and PAP phosphatase NrnA